VGGAARPMFAAIGFCGGCFPWFAWGVGWGLTASFLTGLLPRFVLCFSFLFAGVL